MTTCWAIFVHEVAIENEFYGGRCWLPDAWLVAYDPDANAGAGNFTTDVDVDHAKRFETIEDALAYYRQTSTVKPTRRDGLPNRPLTAFNVSIRPVAKLETAPAS